MQKYGTRIMSWRPFAQGRNHFFTNETLTAIAGKYEKSVVQVALRFLIQRGVAVIPKTTHKERMIQNFDIFGFSLSAGNLKKLPGLIKGKACFLSHYDPVTVEFLIGMNL